MATVINNRPAAPNVILNNDTGTALVQYELTVIGNLVVIADEAIANGAEGSFYNVEGATIQISDFVVGEDTFATENAVVYFDPATGDFSDTDTLTYYPIGIVKTIKNANSVVEVLIQRETELRSVTTAYIAADAVVTAAYIAADTVVTNAYIAADTAQQNLSGKPFFQTATLTAAAASTNVDILTDVQVGSGTVVITSFLLNVNGATAWTDSTGTVVTIQDKAGSPVLGISAAKAQLTGNAILDLLSTGITLSDPVSDGIGFTATNGIDIVADSDFDAGSDIIVTVAGYII
jgi:hypothetical protein